MKQKGFTLLELMIVLAIIGIIAAIAIPAIDRNNTGQGTTQNTHSNEYNYDGGYIGKLCYEHKIILFINNHPLYQLDFNGTPTRC